MKLGGGGRGGGGVAKPPPVYPPLRNKVTEIGKIFKYTYISNMHGSNYVHIP